MLGLGLVALAGVSAVKAAGGRLRNRHEPAIDALAAADHQLTHHRLPTADGGELHVVEAGVPEGRPIVLMHGVTLQWWVWSALITLLEDRYRILAWDMRGHGESRAGSDGVSLEATADDLALLLDELDLRDAVLVGHSMGGMTMGHVVDRHRAAVNERVGAMYFVATSACAVEISPRRGDFRTVWGIAGLGLVTGLRLSRKAYPWRNDDLSAVLLRTVFGRNVSADMIDTVRKMLADMAPASMVEAGNSLAQHDVRRVLPFVDVPTAVVVGDADRITPPGHAREIAELVPGATLTVLPGVGHQIMQEMPSALAAGIDGLGGVGGALVSAV